MAHRLTGRARHHCAIAEEEVPEAARGQPEQRGAACVNEYLAQQPRGQNPAPTRKRGISYRSRPEHGSRSLGEVQMLEHFITDEEIVLKDNELTATGIRNVWNSNAESEFFKMCSVMAKGYNYVALHVVTVGRPYIPNQGKLETLPNEYDKEYLVVRKNAFKCDPLHYAFSLFDSRGNSPNGIHTWQFNIKFKPRDMYPGTSKHVAPIDIKVLKTLQDDAGFRLNDLSFHGIELADLAQMFTDRRSPVNNRDLRWLSYNGLEDFAYLWKLVGFAKQIPLDRTDFLKAIGEKCGRNFDVRYLATMAGQSVENGLEGVSQCLGVERIGQKMHGGSEACLTGNAFFTAFSQWFPGQSLNQYNGQLYGTGSTSVPAAPILYPFVSSITEVRAKCRPSGPELLRVSTTNPNEYYEWMNAEEEAEVQRLIDSLAEL